MARFKRRTLHVPNLMQMRKISCFRPFALDSAHGKFDVGTLKKKPVELLTEIRKIEHFPLIFGTFPVVLAIFQLYNKRKSRVSSRNEDGTVG